MVRIMALLAGIFLTKCAFGLDPNRKMSQYLRDQWGAEQGFPAGPVYAISQTPDGYSCGSEREPGLVCVSRRIQLSTGQGQSPEHLRSRACLG